MPELNVLDIAAVVIVILAIASGYKSGAIPQVLGLSGAAAGLAAIIVAGPLIRDQMSGSDQVTRAVVVLLVVLAAIGVGEMLGSIVGSFVRGKIGNGLLGKIDKVLGAGVGIAQSLFIIWLAGGLLAIVPVQQLTTLAQRSVVVRGIDAFVPPPTAFSGEIQRLLDATGVPDLFLGLDPFPAEPVPLPTLTQAEAFVKPALTSTFEVKTSACGYNVTGTGFAIGTGYVVTNAHVIAGGTNISVTNGSKSWAATPVLFDPKLDVTLLRVPGLTATPLHFTTKEPARGATGAALGYPRGGALTVIPAAVRTVYHDVEGRDLYGTGTTTRTIIELTASIDRGDSGGPLILSDGTVGGVIFAESRTDSAVGYALDPIDVAREVMPLVGATATVSTGACVR